MKFEDDTLWHQNDDTITRNDDTITRNDTVIILFPCMFILTYFRSMFHFYTPRKRLKTKGFLIFSGGLEIYQLSKMS